jgi:hypothetical protein
VTNEQAQAYATVAMDNCGISPLTVRRVMEEMEQLFDIYDEQEIMAKAGRLRITVIRE